MVEKIVGYIRTAFTLVIVAAMIVNFDENAEYNSEGFATLMVILSFVISAVSILLNYKEWKKSQS